MFLAAGFTVELQLDWQKQKGGVRRALFLASRQATLRQTLLIQNGAREDCREMKIYLRVRPQGRRTDWPGLGVVSHRTGVPLEIKETGKFQCEAWDFGAEEGALLSEELGTRLLGPWKERERSYLDTWILEGPEWTKRCERLRSRTIKSPVFPDTVNSFPHPPQNESEFRDKLSPIHIALNFSLDPQAPVDSHGLRPVLHYQSKSRIEDKVRRGGREEIWEEIALGTRGRAVAGGAFSSGGSLNSPSQGYPGPQAQILLDCGEDNICVPDLQLEVFG